MTHLQYTMRGCHRCRNYILLFIQGQGRQASVVTLFLPTFFNHPPPSLLRVPAEYLRRSAVGRAPREAAVENTERTEMWFSALFSQSVANSHNIWGKKKELSFISRPPLGIQGLIFGRRGGRVEGLLLF